jgi:uncharacterized iron-regulated protein
MPVVQSQRRLAPVAATALVASWIAIAACAGARWNSPIGRDHPLTGRIWDVAAGEFIHRPTLINRLAAADFVLLGEQHDNSDHHLLQAGILRGLVAAGRRPAVAFEMLNIDDAPTIARHLRAAPNDAAGLGAAVNWNRRGWPDWTLYQPIAEAALGAKLPIVATNLPGSLVTKISSDGLEALDPQFRRELGLDHPLPEPMLARLTADIRQSHCGYVSYDRLSPMVAVQRARDARMAHSLISSDQSAGAVLIAGAGHVRKDYGIPIYLAAGAPEKGVASVAFMEVADGRTMPRDYAPAGAHGALPYDYVWFTPRSGDQDPCEKFKAQLERLKKPK